MRTIDIDTLNLFLADSDIAYQAIEIIPVTSGQREVYFSMSLQDGDRYIIKVAHYNKYSVGRLQREIQILSNINSSYFPTIILDTFVSKGILDLYYENLSQNEYMDEINAYQSNPIRPFYLTIENFIENIPWSEVKESFDELALLELVKHCFVGLELLWDNKIVHRDLKPDNILIRQDHTPVIIDLGIAKSFNEGTIDLTPGYFQNPHTKRYASPEQLLDRKDDISYKTDQYSIGIIVYNVLCGEFPFGNIDDIGPEELIQNMMTFNYTPIAKAGGNCCDEFEAFIQKLLRPEPHQRFRTTKAIFQALNTIQGALQ